LNFVLLQIFFFYVFGLFWCDDVKNNFFFLKNNNFDKFVSEKHVEKLSLPLFQTIHPDVISDGEAFFNFCLMVEDRWKQT